MMIHTSRIGEETNPHYHWHIEIMPKLTKVAGFEWGSRILYLPHATGRVREVFARGADNRSLATHETSNLTLFQVSISSDFSRKAFRLKRRTFRYTAVLSGARYPSGLRERSAKPPFVGSTPTRASKRERASFVLRKRRSGRVECPDAVGRDAA